MDYSTKTLYVNTSEDVIFTSPWIIAEGLLPHRIVIRNLGPAVRMVSGTKYTCDNDEYVVQDEVLTENKETGFMSGHYTTDIEEAIEVFADRSKRSLKKGLLAKEVQYV